jgi:Mu B transposition protein, C terminal
VIRKLAPTPADSPTADSAPATRIARAPELQPLDVVERLRRERSLDSNAPDQIADEAGVDRVTLHHFITSRSSFSQRIAQSVRPILDQRDAARAGVSDVPAVDRLRLLPCQQRAISAFRQARDLQITAEVIVPPCSGATFAANYFKNSAQGVLVATVAPGDGNDAGIRRATNRAIWPTSDATPALGLMVDRLSGFSLLIVEHAEHCVASGFEMLAYLAEESHLGVALLSTRSLLTHPAVSPRFAGRLAMSADGAPRRPDAIKFIESLAVTDDAVRRELLAAFGSRGGLRAIINVLRLATLNATAMGEPLARIHVAAAMRELRMRGAAADAAELPPPVHARRRAANE